METVIIWDVGLITSGVPSFPQCPGDLVLSKDFAKMLKKAG